jgi:carboxymethylenebutenolidase
MTMERKKASDYPPEVLQLFDGYVHGTLSRRDFLDRAAGYTAGGLGAVALLQSLAPNHAWAQQVPAGDKRIAVESVEYASPKGSGRMRGYLARPAKRGKAPGVVVIHENRGLNPYIEDVARRLAVAGYVAFAPDALAPVGGYPGDEDKARELFAKLDASRRNEDLLAAYPVLEKRPECNGRVAATGFCFGGGVVGLMATRLPNLVAAVPFYGSQPSAEDTARIKAPLLIHYAESDPRINAGWPAWEDALKLHGIRYQMYMYPGTQHAFHNDTTPRYDERAAKLAWSRTLDFLEAHLRG